MDLDAQAAREAAPALRPTATLVPQPGTKRKNFPLARTNSLAGPLKAVPTSINTPLFRPLPTASASHRSGTCCKIPIRRLADAFATRQLSDAELAALPDDEVIERLTAIKGVGRWTAETALLRGLARLDAFPAGDLAVVKYLAQGLLGHAEKASEEAMRRYAERWRPYRGLALVYAYARLAEQRARTDQKFAKPLKACTCA